MTYYKHPQALVESIHIGADTRIWAFTHILPRAVIGAGCNLCDHVYIENDVIIGDRVTIKNGVQIWDGIRLEDDVFIGPNATFTNDRFPRSGQHQASPCLTTVKKGASIGANATILPGLVIEQHAMVGAGAVVTKNVPPHAIVAGNPAKIIGYEPSVEKMPISRVEPAPAKKSSPLLPGTARLITLPFVSDLRGNLSVAELGKDIPFTPRRFFWVFDVPNREVRGAHAHRQQHQVLICIKGALSVMLDDGQHRDEILLDQPNLALYIPPMIWAVEYKYSPDSVLLVLASGEYDAADYIRDYETFIQLVNPDS
ncbi:MAG TPA: WxcM-like domain-containing protein [Anaerolineaceae bacterium]|nr:WxcM-like domain-containing protein [Anaerolineaceae bacterium]HPN52292.1 WxcM-like domain-containing protein [Anaerolineaceae bacterium]